MEGNHDEAWESIEFEFSEYRDVLLLRLETKDEAVGRRHLKGKKTAEWKSETPTWFDPTIGKSVRPWLLIPYIDAIDQEYIKELLERLRELTPKVELGIRTRELSAQFLRLWGAFCAAAGAIELVYHSQQNVGHARSAKSGGEAVSLDGQRRWFSHYFLKVYRHGKRREAEDYMLDLISSIVEKKYGDLQNFDVKWSKKMLVCEYEGDPGRLKSTFLQKESPAKKMKELQRKDPSGLPPLDLKFPTLKGSGRL